MQKFKNYGSQNYIVKFFEINTHYYTDGSIIKILEFLS